MAEDIYSIGALTKRYASPDGDEEFTLEVPSLTIRRGQRVGIVAESGFGKSTLLDLLLFALKPSSAESFVFRTDDRSTDVAEAWRAGGSGAFSDIRKHHIGAVIQTGGLLPFVSARAN
ncbi:MAG: ATP-binding cassette domain-containing protein, partial [Chromatiales bacterium]|nr:ATP-binding cassette domain-containing protein [Chromatiales bacterium]